MLAKRNRTRLMIAMSVFLALTCIVELIGAWMSYHSYHNARLYSSFTFFEFVFYQCLFRWELRSPKIKFIITIVLLFYLVCGLLNIFLIQKDDFQSYNYVLGCIIIVVWSVVYFNSLFRVPENESLVRMPFFWIAIGVMFYYTCTFSIYGLHNFITSTMNYYNRVLTFIEDLLNITLYTLFTIGFLCHIRIPKSLGLS